MKVKLFILIAAIFSMAKVSTAQSAKERMQMADDIVKQDRSGYYSIEGFGTIKFNDGNQLDGQVNLKVTNNIGTQGRLQFFPEGKMIPIDYFPSQVEYFQIGNTIFYPIDVKYEMKSYKIFATILNQNPTDKMSLYRLYIAEASSQQGATSPFYLKKSFFQKMASDKVATQLGGMSLKPFHKSMSSDVEDCPALAAKIKEKEEGYKVVLVDINNNNEDVYLRVCDEYNACK